LRGCFSSEMPSAFHARDYDPYNQNYTTQILVLHRSPPRIKRNRDSSPG
jgi:hypothetical protein